MIKRIFNFSQTITCHKTEIVFKVKVTLADYTALKMFRM